MILTIKSLVSHLYFNLLFFSETTLTRSHGMEGGCGVSELFAHSFVNSFDLTHLTILLVSITSLL